MERTPGLKWGERGTTLVELAIALLAASVLFVAVVVIWQQSLVAYFHSSETANLQQEARIGYEKMTRELRLAGVHPCTGNNALLSQAASDSVTVQYDLLPSDTVDCSTLPPSQEVKFSYDSANSRLTRQLSPTASPAGSIDPLTGGRIGTLTFTYWDCSGTELVPSGSPSQLTAAQLALVARITVTIGASENYEQGTQTVALARQMVANVHLRGKSCTNVGF